MGIGLAHMKTTADRAIDMQTVMDGMGLGEIEATFVVDLARGETTGCIKFTGPVSPQQRRRMGLDIVAGEDDELDLGDDDNPDV